LTGSVHSIKVHLYICMQDDGWLGVKHGCVYYRMSTGQMVNVRCQHRVLLANAAVELSMLVGITCLLRQLIGRQYGMWTQFLHHIWYTLPFCQQLTNQCLFKSLWWNIWRLLDWWLWSFFISAHLRN